MRNPAEPASLALGKLMTSLLQDPVNGSSHTVLAPHFWQGQTLVASMESKRGGILRLQCVGEGEGGRVHMGGGAVVVTQGFFNIPGPLHGLSPAPSSAALGRVRNVLGHLKNQGVPRGPSPS
jgi:hypothetical protein